MSGTATITENTAIHTNGGGLFSGTANSRSCIHTGIIHGTDATAEPRNAAPTGAAVASEGRTEIRPTREDHIPTVRAQGGAPAP